MEQYKVMAITYLKPEEIKSRLGVFFRKSEDMLGPLYIAEGGERAEFNYKIRVRENSPQPATEIMLLIENASDDLDKIIRLLKITRDDLFWIHPRAGGTLRRSVVDTLIANLEKSEPLIQILVGPRQVGKTTAVEHLKREWDSNTYYVSADTVVGDYGPWLERVWQEAIQKGEGALLIIDEIQKVDNWVERVKLLWDKTKKRGIRVVVLGSTSLTHFLTSSGRESLAGRFNAIYVPHWSYPETYEAFGAQHTQFTLFGGYPKAMELSKSPQKWFEYIGQSIINPIIDIDIFQLGNFKKVENLRRAFKVFSQEVSQQINYTHMLKEIQQTGNTEIIKKYLEGYFDSFLFSPLHLIDDNGTEDTRTNSILMANCPAIYTFGRNNVTNFDHDTTRFRQAVANDLRRISSKSFGHWRKDVDVHMDFFLKTSDNKEFGIFIEEGRKLGASTKSYEMFRKTFKKARVVSITSNDLKSLSEGPRAFLESAGI